MPLIAPNVGRIVAALQYGPFPQYWAYNIKSGIGSASADRLDATGALESVRVASVDWQVLAPSLPSLSTATSHLLNRWAVITPVVPGPLVKEGSVACRYDVSGTDEVCMIVWDVDGGALHFRKIDGDPGSGTGQLKDMSTPVWDPVDEKLYWAEIESVDGAATEPTVTVNLMQAAADLTGVTVFGTSTVPTSRFTMSEIRFDVRSVEIMRGGVNTDIRFWGWGMSSISVQTQKYNEWFRFNSSSGAFIAEENETSGTFGSTAIPRDGETDPFGAVDVGTGRLSSYDTQSAHSPSTAPTETEIWPSSWGDATYTGVSTVKGDAALYAPFTNKLIAANHAGTIPGSPEADFTAATYSFVGLAKELP